MLASVTALLASHLAAGALFVTAVLALANQLPIAFVRFCSASAAGAATLAALLDSGSTRWVWLGLALVGVGWHVALRYESLAVAGAVTSSLLLGAVTVTMILGHWYLVDTRLSIAPLRDGALWFSIAVVLRWAAVITVLGYGGWEVLRVSRAADFIFSTNGLFFVFRTLMGLAAPLLLSVLIWQTVKMRSTQSATGLLYVALILVLFGELVSQFLFVRTGFPL